MGHKLELGLELEQVNKKKSRVALLSVASNTVLTTSKIAVGLISGSVSILSEGIHSGLDLLAACIAFFAVRQSGKPADSKHAYGHGKIENVSGTIEAGLIIVAVVLIVMEAVRKLIDILNGGSGEVGSMALTLGLVVMGGAALANLFVSSRLMKVAKETDSVALEADALHLRTDVFTSAGVFLGLILIRLTGWHILDPIVALVVAVIISKAAYDLLKEAFLPLIDVSLPEDERETITRVLAGHEEQFVEFHDLRTRKAGAERYVDLHLVMPRNISIGEVHELCDVIEDEVNAQLRGAQVLIHAEPCTVSKEACPLEQGLATTCQRCQSVQRNLGKLSAARAG
ncbi:MAG: cation diffusion facilitator family transporter [Eggerthellaceae bacterium]|jgi:cation diffusion facilitator family transporter|nr:cation diffusion facilitator family transporter [Eggerthellaceae bacterium]MDR2715276.1 cation diffusion facilitator family transporter [Coriobacteriaceae bacterium]